MSESSNKAVIDQAGLDLVWGAEAIAKVIGNSTRKTFHLLESGFIPATKCGRQWVASRAALRKRFEAVLSGQAA